MIISNNLSSKRFLVIFGALVISLVLIIAQHDPVWAVSRAGKFLQREVWHHSQTVGILVFHGGQRTLLECQLILIEGTRELDDKPALLDSLQQKNYPIYEVKFETMLDIVEACSHLQIQRNSPLTSPFNKTKTAVNMWSLLKESIQFHFQSKIQKILGILPGTKWCGFNDLADNYHDLGSGSYFEVDKCCRSHDHCPIKVHSFDTNYGVTNYHPYTKSHCACDDIFYKCLKAVTEPNPDTNAMEIAENLGRIYFNVLSLECAEPSYPKVCLHYTKALPGSIDPEAEMAKTPKKKLWFNFNQEETEVSSTEKPWEYRCVEYDYDMSATPTFTFRKPNRLF